MNPTPAVFGSLGEASLPPRPVHLAIGMFDGVHRGHQAVIESAVQAARSAGALAGVFTFWPHPSRLLAPGSAVPMIFGRGLRTELLLGLGIDFAVEQTFDHGFASIEAGDFVAWLKRGLPGLATIYVGENWRFGHGRRGDVGALVRLAGAEGVSVVSVSRLNFNGQPISSSRIRKLLQRGEVPVAGGLLGFPYFAVGEVSPGRQLGRTIGFPTLNIPWSSELRPAFGVYAVRVRRAKGKTRAKTFPGVSNYGVRPTVAGSGDPLLEVHLLGPCPFGAGDELHVDWLHFIRSEQRFGSIDDLRAQIARDREAAVAFFEDPASAAAR